MDRGGKREGAGRPSKGERIKIAPFIKPGTKGILERLGKEWGKSQGEVIDQLAEEKNKAPDQ